jgi:hypothetical protein
VRSEAINEVGVRRLWLPQLSLFGISDSGALLRRVAFCHGNGNSYCGVVKNVASVLKHLEHQYLTLEEITFQDNSTLTRYGSMYISFIAAALATGSKICIATYKNLHNGRINWLSGWEVLPFLNVAVLFGFA